MNCVAIALSPIEFIPLVQTEDFSLAEKAMDYIKQHCSKPGDVVTIVSGSDDYGAEAAENYSWVW